VSVARDTYGIDTSANNQITNLNYLFVDPSAPVFVNTNRVGGPLPTRPQDLTIAFISISIVTDAFNRPVSCSRLTIAECDLRATNWVVGDPQWIGIPRDPTRPHTNDNRLIGRARMRLSLRAGA
jgi:hypothetical protein